MRWTIALICCCLMPMQTAWGGDVFLRIGTQRIHATVANTPQSREHGLMNRTQLCKNCGMLFVFPRPEKYRFWMKDTPLPLSIAFIAADGRILNIAEMQAYSTDIHAARENIIYALEMNKTWFADHSISPGDLVQGLQHLPQGQ